MKISTKDWAAYIARLSELDKAAGDQMLKWIQRNGFEDTQALLDFAYSLVTKYGEGSATLAAEMYDAIAQMQHAAVEAAVPAATATYGETAAAIRGTMKISENADMVAATTGRLVKQAGADTMVQNAKRDGAYFAWIPSGDTCPFCLMLASNGWQKASKRTIKGDHADHIHAHCNCTFAIRFDNSLEVEGYDPEKYKARYNAAEGDTWQEKINDMRQVDYGQRKEEINAQKREAYLKRTEREVLLGKDKSITIDSNLVSSQSYRMLFHGITGDSRIDDIICENSRDILRHRTGTYKEDLILLDANTGKTIFSNTNTKVDSAIEYDAAVEKAILKAHEEGKRILAIHNHPNSFPPTIDDGVSAFNHGYDMGVVACHDGTVYTYTPASFALSESECEMIHNSIAYQIKMGAELEDVWYDILKEFGMNITRRR